MKLSKTSFSVIIIVFVICFFLSQTTSSAKIYHLTILHTNTHSGHFVKFDEYPVRDIGGMAARSTLINIVRAEVEQAGGHVLLLSAGDVNIGTPESDLLYAEPDFKLMKMLGYDAMTIGNLDLHHPLKMLMKQREWAGFPFLSANVIRKDTGELVVDPYTIKEFDGLKLAIFGLTIEQSDYSAKHGRMLDSKNVIETAKELVPKLKEQADLVVALTHIGQGLQDTSGGGNRTPGDIQLAEEIPEIDLIVGGELHPIFTGLKVIGDTPLVHPDVYGRYVGRLDLTIDSEAEKKIREYTHTLIPVNLKKQVKYKGKSYSMYIDKGYVEDPAVLEFIQPYLEQVDELLSQPVGEALVRLDGDRELLYAQETNLANLVTDGMRAKTGAEIAFENAGAMRTSIDKGTITYRDILKVLPFRDRLILLDMTGAQVMNVLRYAATVTPGRSGVLHVSGLTWTINKGVPEQVMVGDSPIELERVYKVVTNNYVAAGKPNYPAFENVPQYDTGFTDASVMREYIMKKGKVAPKVVGRLTIIE